MNNLSILKNKYKTYKLALFENESNLNELLRGLSDLSGDDVYYLVKRIKRQNKLLKMALKILKDKINECN